jgi:NitT/TauT family transport system ATP-binding protein
MQSELLRIWSEARKTALFITHQIDEAIYLADRVVVMTTRPGKVLADIPIELGRPRPLTIKLDEEFLRYEQRIWGLLEDAIAAAM